MRAPETPSPSLPLSANATTPCNCAAALPPPTTTEDSTVTSSVPMEPEKDESELMRILPSASKVMACIFALFGAASTGVVVSQRALLVEIHPYTAVMDSPSFQPLSVANNPPDQEQQKPCLSLRAESQSSILSPDGSLASGVKFSTLLRAVVEEYMSDKDDIRAVGHKDDDDQYYLLEAALRKMQQDESSRGLYLPTSTATTTAAAAAASTSRSALAGATYTSLRKAILKDYFASSPETADPWKQLKDAIAAMQKAEIDGVAVQVEGYPYLHIGSAGAAYNFTSLLSAGITHIVNTSPSVTNRFQGAFHYMHIDDVTDHGAPGESLLRYFPTTSRFIEEARKSGGKVLVHCSKGKSRSASLLAAYLMQFHGFTRDPALALIRRNRPITKPSSPFMADLERFERNQREREADDDTPLPKGTAVVSANGSLVADAKYSTIRRAVVGEYVDLKIVKDASPKEKLELGLEAMQTAELLNDDGIKQDGPLAGVTYSQLEDAVLNQFNQYFAVLNRSPDDTSERLGRALSVMRMIEVDGEPVPIGEKNITALPTIYIGGAGALINSIQLFCPTMYIYI